MGWYGPYLAAGGGLVVAGGGVPVHGDVLRGGGLLGLLQHHVVAVVAARVAEEYLHARPRPVPLRGTDARYNVKLPTNHLIKHFVLGLYYSYFRLTKISILSKNF